MGSDTDDSGNHSEITSNGFTTCFGTNLLLVAAAPSKVCLHSTWLSDQELYKVVDQPVAGHPIGAGLC